MIIGGQNKIEELSDLKWKILTKILDEPEKFMNEIAKVGEFAIYGN